MKKLRIITALKAGNYPEFFIEYKFDAFLKDVKSYKVFYEFLDGISCSCSSTPSTTFGKSSMFFCGFL